LGRAGWAPLPSVTNFLLVRFPGGDAARSAAERLLRSGIVPRTFPEASLLSAHLRLTVRSEGENARLLEVIGS
jgi:histidinol-phosphate/aromatic aminotransferase/cobyric acid decarboxylase-like protein